MNAPNLIDSLLASVRLKDLARAGWLRDGIAQPESVAAHSWGVAWLVIVLLPRELDLARALTYAVLHDLPEINTGDITPFDGVSPQAKHQAEAQAMAQICLPLPHHLAAYWQAYTAHADAEARFVHQLDKLDMAIQAVAYARTLGPKAQAFLDSADASIKDPQLRDILQQLREYVA